MWRGSLDGEEKIRHNEQRYGFDPSTHPPLPDCRLCDVGSVTYTLWASVFSFVKCWCPPHPLVNKNDRKWVLADRAPRRELPFAPLYPHLLNFQTRLMQLLFLRRCSLLKWSSLAQSLEMWAILTFLHVSTHTRSRYLSTKFTVNQSPPPLGLKL